MFTLIVTILTVLAVAGIVLRIADLVCVDTTTITNRVTHRAAEGPPAAHTSRGGPAHTGNSR